jgi:hypothetical protein
MAQKRSNAQKKKNKIQKKENKVSKEVTFIGKALRAIGSVGGTMAGGLIGQPAIGSSIGSSLGATVSKWLGQGDYTVSSNSLVNLKSNNSIPMMHTVGQSVMVRHKEYICDIIAGTGTPTAFGVAKTLALNPGISSTFPWLSTIAQQFQEYEFKGLVFHFLSTSGESVSSTNTSLGSVMAATQYNFINPAFTSKLQMLNEYFSSDSKPSSSFAHPLECDPKENPFNVHYVRSNDLPSGADQALYDLGTTTVATQGIPTTGVNCGELWVTYEVELKKPVEAGYTQQDAGVAFYEGTTSITTTNVFGTSISKQSIDTIGLTISTGGLITFPRGSIGTYLICVWHDACSALDTITVTPTNCTHNNLACRTNATNDMFFKYSVATVVSGGPTDVRMYSITDSNAIATIQYAYGTLTGCTTCDIRVFQVSNLSLATYA